MSNSEFFQEFREEKSEKYFDFVQPLFIQVTDSFPFTGSNWSYFISRLGYTL